MNGATRANGMIGEARVVSQAIIERLDSLAENTERLYVRENYLYVQRIMTVPAGDTAVADVVMLPPGVIWRVRRFAITAGINSGFAVYLNEAQPQNLLDGEFNNAAMAAWSPGGDGIYVPQGNSLALRFYGQAAGQVCSVNMRVTEIKVEE